MSSTRTGKVTGSRADGPTSPTSTSARARPPSWPGNHCCTIAAAPAAQSRMTGAPLFTTTTVFGLAAITARTRLWLRAGQVEIGAVDAFGLPLTGGADDHDGHVAAAGGGDRPFEGIGGQRLFRGERQPGHRDGGIGV